VHEDGGDGCHGHLEGEGGGEDPAFALAEGAVEGGDEGCAEQEGDDGGEGFGPGEGGGGDGEVVGAEGEEDCVSCLVWGRCCVSCMFLVSFVGWMVYFLVGRLTCIETKHEYALYAQLSTRPETMKQTIRTRSAHLVETSAERCDLTFCKTVVGPGGDELLPLTMWLPSRGPSRYEYL
jgi:hypothetical protein